MYYQLYVCHHDDVLRIAEELVKRTIIKRTKLEEAISRIKSHNWFYCSDKLRFLTKEALEELYWKEEKSMTEIAKIYHVCWVSIRLKMMKFGIPIRPQKEAVRLWAENRKRAYEVPL